MRMQLRHVGLYKTLHACGVMYILYTYNAIHDIIHTFADMCCTPFRNCFNLYAQYVHKHYST